MSRPNNAFNLSTRVKEDVPSGGCGSCKGSWGRGLVQPQKDDDLRLVAVGRRESSARGNGRINLHQVLRGNDGVCARERT